MIWDTSDWTCRAVLCDHFEWVTAVAFSPDGAWLATGSWDDRFGLPLHVY